MILTPPQGILFLKNPVYLVYVPESLKSTTCLRSKWAICKKFVLKDAIKIEKGVN